MKPLIFLLCSLAIAAAFRDPVTLKHGRKENVETSNFASANDIMKWATDFFEVKLDHFRYSDTQTFKMKYLYNNSYYQPGGPIFFYTGNEGDIEGFAVATGMMWDLAPMFNASIIFAEHRFYGESQPFGNKSYSTLENMGYLTSEQALADYVDFITDLKNPFNSLPMKFSPSTPVIAFGGSYGGMLSAWFRMKYPHIIAGAWASSAPVLFFQGAGIDAGKFDSITTRTYAQSGCNNFIVANAWNAILNLSLTDDGRKYLNSIYNLDPRTPIKNETDGWNLNYFIREGIEYMAMVDYPYPTSFLEPMPGQPVKVACNFMTAPGQNFTDEQLALWIGQAAGIYYNYTGTAAPYCIDPSICGDVGTDGLGGSPLGWPWQECSEIIIEMCARGGANDFFWNECGNDTITLLEETCEQTFGSLGWNSNYWDILAVPKLYGLTMASTSNIILTQGQLDLWSGGGFQANSPGVDQKRGIYALEIPGSAHHLDLRFPNECDTNTISNARYQIVQILKCFIRSDNCASPPQLTKLPSPLEYSSLPDDKCTDVVNGYPWEQEETKVTTEEASSTVTATRDITTATPEVTTATQDFTTATPEVKTATPEKEFSTTTTQSPVASTTVECTPAASTKPPVTTTTQKRASGYSMIVSVVVAVLMTIG